MTELQGFLNNSGAYRLEESQMALLKSQNPIIDIVGNVDISMYSYVRTAIRYLRSKGSPEVQVLISSPGGDVDSGLDIYDELRLYPGKKIATVNDKAASMGALILQGCDVRQCAKYSHVLIHHVSRSNVILDVLRSKRRLADLIASMEESQRKLYEILAMRTGKTVPEIRRACAKDRFMNAQEALDFGLIDAII